MAALAIVYVMAGLAALCCLGRHNFLAGSSMFVLSGRTQKLIRAGALLMPIPALIYSAWFTTCLLTYDASASAAERVTQLSQFETAVFGKSVLSTYIRQERPSAAADHDVDFSPYMAALQTRIKSNWSPPQASDSKHVVVQFKVFSDGRLANLCVVTSSGLKTADEAALKAVEHCAPFERLPAGAPSDVDIQFTLDYNVYGSTANDQEEAGDNNDSVDTFSSAAR